MSSTLGRHFRRDEDGNYLLAVSSAAEQMVVRLHGLREAVGRATRVVPSEQETHAVNVWESEGGSLHHAELD